MSVARFHAFVHLLVEGAAEGLFVLHLEVQQSQRRTARLAGWGHQDDWRRAHWSQAPGRGGGGVEIQTRDSNAQSIARRKCSGKDFNDLACSDGFMMTSLNMVRHDLHDYIWTRANWKWIFAYNLLSFALSLFNVFGSGPLNELCQWAQTLWFQAGSYEKWWTTLFSLYLSCCSGLISPTFHLLPQAFHHLPLNFSYLP